MVEWQTHWYTLMYLSFILVPMWNLDIKRKARELRTKGYGYKTIRKELDNQVPWKTIANWTHDIIIDKQSAYKTGIIRNQKSLEATTSKSGRRSVLIRERGYVCEDCGVAAWKGKVLPLELDHINGNNQDNRSENLKLLCPNCHSITPTWRRKKCSFRQTGKAATLRT